MERQTIQIAGKDYQIGFSFRSIKIYEDLTKRSISEANSTYENLLFFYATLKALNKDFKMSLDQFIDEMDNHPDLLIQFTTTQEQTQQPEETTKKKQTTKELFGLWTLSLLLLALPIWLPVISTIFLILMSLRLLLRLIASLGKRRASP